MNAAGEEQLSYLKKKVNSKLRPVQKSLSLFLQTPKLTSSLYFLYFQ